MRAEGFYWVRHELSSVEEPTWEPAHWDVSYGGRWWLTGLENMVYDHELIEVNETPILPPS